MHPSKLVSRASSALFFVAGSLLVACGASDGSEEPTATSGQDVTMAPKPPPLVGDPAHGIFDSASCDAPTILWCAGTTYTCLPACVDSQSWACKTCIENEFTAGVDCWSCLFGGGGNGSGSAPPPSSYFACQLFPGDPDVTGTPRQHDPNSKIQESCSASQYNYRTRAWQRECCLYRAR